MSSTNSPGGQRPSPSTPSLRDLPSSSSRAHLLLRVPYRIVRDNGTKFTSGLFKSYCTNIGTQICYGSVAHPRSNGQAERVNAEVLRGLKTRSFNKKLAACSKDWFEELMSVLWSICTTTTKPTSETPLFLVYGAEVVLPAEIKHQSPQVLAFYEAR